MVRQKRLKAIAAILICSFSMWIIEGCAVNEAENLAQSVQEGEKTKESTVKEETILKEEPLDDIRQDVSEIRNIYGYYLDGQYVTAGGGHFAFITGDNKICVVRKDGQKLLLAEGEELKSIFLIDRNLCAIDVDGNTRFYWISDEDGKITAQLVGEPFEISEAPESPANSGAGQEVYPLFYQALQDLTQVQSISVSGESCSFVAKLKDGTVEFYRGQGNAIKKKMVEEWTDKEEISIGYDNCLGLNADGSVSVLPEVQSDFFQPEEFLEWENVIDIEDGLFALRADGIVLTVGNYKEDMEEIEDWDSIVQISADPLNERILAGVCCDGKVVISGGEEVNPEAITKDWSNIRSIKIENHWIIAVDKDNRVLALNMEDIDAGTILVEDVCAKNLEEAEVWHGVY